MYKIIGADGKEYGPISAEVLRQWIAEGRANLQTQILPEGSTEWKPLSEFPEFAAAVPGPAAAPRPFAAGAQPIVNSSAAADRVGGPAVGLIVVAILGFLGQVAGLVWQLGFARSMMANQPQMPWANAFSPTISIVSAIIGILVSGVILFGALKMKRLENHGMAMTSSILAMLPCVSPCCVLGLPIGIWALVVLTKPEVKNAFH